MGHSLSNCPALPGSTYGSDYSDGKVKKKKIKLQTTPKRALEYTTIFEKSTRKAESLNYFLDCISFLG